MVQADRWCLCLMRWRRVWSWCLCLRVPRMRSRRVEVAARLVSRGAQVHLGFPDEELIAAGYTRRSVEAWDGRSVRELRDAHERYTVRELKEYGFVVADFRGIYTVRVRSSGRNLLWLPPLPHAPARLGVVPCGSVLPRAASVLPRAASVLPFACPGRLASRRMRRCLRACTCMLACLRRGPRRGLHCGLHCGLCASVCACSCLTPRGHLCLCIVPALRAGRAACRTSRRTDAR